MTWIYLLFFGSIVYGLGDNGNPFTQPAFWITGAIIATYWGVKLKAGSGNSPAAKNPNSILPAEGVRFTSRADMLEGIRGWKEGGEVPANVAIASCALNGRDPSNLRSLLTVACLKGDASGQVVAAGVRRILSSHS